MNVSLTRELERLVSRKVASGRYRSASEVVREALRLLEDQDRLRQTGLEELRAAVDVGLRELGRGQRRRFDDAAIQRIKADGRRRLDRMKKRA